MSDVPQDFSDALKGSGLEEYFLACAPSHRREYLKWIAEAKRPETRKKRIGKAVKMLSEKSAKTIGRSKKNA